jgi:hypothetical protein
MNKAQIENISIEKSNPSSTIRSRSESESSGSSTQTGSSTSDDDEYQEEDEDEEIIQVEGLFSDKVFNSVKDLFKYEFENNNFNLIDIINRYQMSMIDYIKMINFIRAEVGL